MEVVSVYKNLHIWYYINMIIQDNIDWSIPGVKLKKIQEEVKGAAIALIIGEEVALTMAVDKEFADLIIPAVDFIEDPESDELNNIYIVSFKSNGEDFKFRCTEMVYAILLSDPLILEINESYNNYRYVSPGWRFISNEFVLPEENI